MQEHTDEQDIRERLNLISTMIAEGRRTTQSFSWIFILWGVAYFVAIAWSTRGAGWAMWGHNWQAWPVTMISACALSWVLAMRRFKGGANHPSTTLGRAISSIWIAMGMSMFILLFSMGMSGRSDQQVFAAIIAALLGSTNAASGILLRWKQQFACAIVWWAAAVVSCFGSVAQSTVAFLVATFLCQIVFGICGMMLEARVRKIPGAVHA